MNIRLVEHLQKLAEEDLFPEASEEELEAWIPAYNASKSPHDRHAVRENILLDMIEEYTGEKFDKIEGF